MGDKRGSVSRDSGGKGLLGGLVASGLAGGNLANLSGGERSLPLKQTLEIRTPMIEREYVEWRIVSTDHNLVAIVFLSRQDQR